MCSPLRSTTVFSSLAASANPRSPDLFGLAQGSEGRRQAASLFSLARLGRPRFRLFRTVKPRFPAGLSRATVAVGRVNHE